MIIENFVPCMYYVLVGHPSTPTIPSSYHDPECGGRKESGVNFEGIIPLAGLPVFLNLPPTRK